MIESKPERIGLRANEEPRRQCAVWDSSLQFANSFEVGTVAVVASNGLDGAADKQRD
jgi:hypothetical protein